MRLLLDARVKRAFLLLWCVGWALVAWMSLSRSPLGDVSDKLTHLLGYAAMTAGTATFCHRARVTLMLAGFAIAVGAGLELLQMLLPWRSAERADLAADAAGVAVGAAVAWAWLAAVVRPLRRAAA